MGVVQGWDEATGAHTVVYEDGDMQTEVLGADDAPYWEVLGDSADCE